MQKNNPTKHQRHSILLIEPYFTGSHAAWSQGYAKYSRHCVDILKLEGRFWKWRMHGAAVTLAGKLEDKEFDLILVSDMLDLTSFLALTRSKTANKPVILYFHENQLCYPWSDTDRDKTKNRDKHYGFINYISALAADQIWFNSNYHMDAFLTECTRLLKHFPDHRNLETIERIRKKSRVCHLGIDLTKFDVYKIDEENEKPVILWNHRWEYDKNAKDFFKACQIMKDRGLNYELAILGENFRQQPKEFQDYFTKLDDRIIQWGYVKRFSDYATWLWKADILPVTSIQDFFGASVMEAIYCQCYPLLPRRLSYPELLSPSDYPSHYYQDFDELVEKLACVLTQNNKVDLRQQVKSYDWSVKARQYDEIISGLDMSKNNI